MGTHRVYREHKFAFGKHLLTLRARTALTQIALAEQIGVHRRSVQNWETGESYPKAEVLQRLIAVFLRHHAFTAGQEREEAHVLWRQAAEDGPYPLPFFDEAWFERTLAQNDERATLNDQSHSASQERSPSPFIAHRSSLVDWGEAMAVPTLYGRDSELQTLRQWIVDDRCRVVTILGLGGIGKSSLAVTIARQVADQFDVVLFRSLQNGPPLAEVLDQTIRSISEQQTTPPDRVPDKIALLVQLFRERRCLVILDNFESLLQPGALVGTYRTGYAEYTELLRSLSTRAHQSCVLVTSREKLAELGSLAGRTAPVRTLPLLGLSNSVCQAILETKDIGGTATEVQALVRMYGGNPLALMLVAEPIRELFGGDIGTFLTAGGSFFNGVGKLLEQQLARSTPLEQTLLYALAIERELVPINVLVAKMSSTVPQRDALVVLESLRRRLLIEQAVDQPALALQPVILEFLTDKLVESVYQEIVAAQPRLLLNHACIQATAKDYVQRSQERLIAAPLLERLLTLDGRANALERRLLAQLDSWRNQPPAAQGYGPGNLVNLLRLLRGDLRHVNLAHLAIRQASLRGVDMQDSSLAGALLQDSVLSEAFDAILAVAVSGTGNYWAASSRRGEIRVWAAGGQTLHRVWRAHTDMVWALTHSPDGKTLASGSWDGAVKLWDVVHGTLHWVGHHASGINRVVFAPDGRLIASSGNDATVRFWNPHSGTQLQILPHPGPVIAIAWSRDGRKFASGDIAGVIRLWELPTNGPPSCVQTIQAHTVWLNGLAFAPDSRTLASVSWDRTMKLWDVASGQLRETVSGHTDRVLRVDWSRDGQVLATSSRDQTLRLWDVEQGRYRAVLRGHSGGIDGLAFAPDGRTLISGSEDGTLRVWDVVDGQCVRVLQGYAPVPYVVDWSPDSARLISGGTDRLVTVWGTTEQKPLRTLSGHGGVVCGVGWSSDGQCLASSEWDNAIRLWEPTSGSCLRVLQHPDDSGNCFYDLAWSPDGRRLASGTNRHGVQVFERAAQSHVWEGRKFPTLIRHVAWRPTGVQLAGAGDDGIVYVWNPDENTSPQRLAGHQGVVRSLAWSPDGKWLASGGGSEPGELFVWDLQRGERVSALMDDAGMVSAVAWGASSALVVSGGGDGTLRCWDIQRGKAVWGRQAHQGTVQSLRRSPDGTRLASCGDDGAIMLWDLRTGKHLQSLRRDRPYERMDITGLTGITPAQRASLLALGAVEEEDNTRAATGAGDVSIATEVYPAVDAHWTGTREAIGLPFQPTSFIGRVAELATIARLLGDPACRLLTLVGPGGIGKTRLAVEVAAGQASAFADGVAFVALAATSTPSQVISAISDTLGISVASHSDPATKLLDHLRERQVLLVLDSFEHLLDPGPRNPDEGRGRDESSADLILDLLLNAPRLTILVTSRERLNMQAEWICDVGGLAYPPEDLNESVVSQRLPDPAVYSAVELFRQRAKQVQLGLELDRASLTTIVRICQYVAGMPLAIELAAASLRMLPLAAIERQIRTNLDVLTTNHRDAPERHRSLRAVFDHSWNLLSEREQALFSRLGVFRGEFTSDAAGQVAGATLPALRALVDKSLVQESRDQRWSNDATMPRLVLLEPLQEYTLERLAARGEQEALKNAHASYYLRVAEVAAAQWDSSVAGSIVAQIDRAYPNITAALQWAQDSGSTTLGLQIAGALWRFWRDGSYRNEGRAWLEALLALNDDRSDNAALLARLVAMDAAAWLASDQHDFARATQLFDQSVPLRRALGQADADPHVLHNAALQARAVGAYQQSTRFWRDALARNRTLSEAEPGQSPLYQPGSIHNSSLGYSLYGLALTLREQGDFAGAVALLEEAVDMYRRIDDRERVAQGLLGLGDVARDQGDAAGTREHTQASLAIYREIGTQWAIGFAINNLALAAYLEGELTRAFALASESVALFRDAQADASLAEALITLGQITRAQGDGAAAYASLTEALRLAMALGPRILVAAALEGLAGVVVSRRHADLATRLLAAAAALREQMGTPVRPVDQAALEQWLATARSTLGDDAFAAVWAETQTTPLEQLFDMIPRAMALDR